MGCKILVLAEHEEGAVRGITWELLGLAHGLLGGAGWGPGDVKALLAGNGVESLASTVAARGAAEVICVEGPALAGYTGDAFHRAIEAVVKSESPEMLLIGHTPDGWDVAPLVAAGLGVPVATECSAIAVDNGRLRFTRKVFNGKFVQVVDMEATRPLVATIQKGAAAAHTGTTQGTVRKVPSPVQEADLRARFIEVKKGAAGAVDLTQAPIIVAGGRGLGAADKFNVIRELADALGAQIGASRPVTDMGWLPHEHQVGSSGVTVSPKLYIACGISGAIQHTAGMRGSGYVVAINKDADAPIFDVSDIGVVGDLFEIVPALTKAVKEAKGKG